MSDMPQWTRRAAVGTLVGGGFSAGFYLTERHQTAARPVSSDVTDTMRNGTQLLAVFVASSTCAASNDPTLRSSMKLIRDGLRAETAREKKIFVSVGVSIDPDPIIGIDFLRGVGPFDQILAGASWLNQGALTFIVRDFPSQHSIPQLVLIERDVVLGDSGIKKVEDRLVGRKVGADGIALFAASFALAGGTTSAPSE